MPNLYLAVNKLPGKINFWSYTVLCAIHTVYGNEWKKMNTKDSNHSSLLHRLAEVFVIQ